MTGEFSPRNNGLDIISGELSKVPKHKKGPGEVLPGTSDNSVGLNRGYLWEFNRCTHPGMSGNLVCVVVFATTIAWVLTKMTPLCSSTLPSCENRCPTQHLVPSRLRATLHIDCWSIPMPTATPIFHSWGCPELGAWASLTPSFLKNTNRLQVEYHREPCLPREAQHKTFARVQGSFLTTAKRF